MKDEMAEQHKYSEKRNVDAHRKLEKAKKTLEESPQGEQTHEEIQGLKGAIAGSERTIRESSKSHSIQAKTDAQREQTQRLMREADKEIHKTERKIEK